MKKPSIYRDLVGQKSSDPAEKCKSPLFDMGIMEHNVHNPQCWQGKYFPKHQLEMSRFEASMVKPNILLCPFCKSLRGKPADYKTYF